MATYIAALAILAVVVRGVIYLFQRAKTAPGPLSMDRADWGRYLAAFVSGILFTNAVPHFVHGVSGETFPAPLAPLLGTGFPEHLSNVIWGFVNIVVGYNLFRIGKVSSSDGVTKVIFFAGVLAMGIFLASAFNR